LGNTDDSVKDLHTTKRFPFSLRKTFYETMLEAVSEELAEWRDLIRQQKVSLYDVDKMDVNQLIQISQLLGVPFITLPESDDDYIKEEVKSIAFKIRYKGTPVLYKSFFYAANYHGEVFIYNYFSNIDELVKSMEPPFLYAASTPANLPFRFASKNDFSGNIKQLLQLDKGLRLDKSAQEDAEENNEKRVWHLDSVLIAASTNHIGLEYFIDKTIKKEGMGGEYLMTNEYLEYLSKSMDFARRVKEVVHIGSQLSVQTDTSGLCNSFDPSREYTIPLLKLKAVTHPLFFDLVKSCSEITQIEFGIGSQKVASAENKKVPFPNELANRVYSHQIPFKYQFNNENYMGAVSEYVGQALNNFKVLDGAKFNGVKDEFEFCLPFSPLREGSVTLEFRLPSGITHSITDDHHGNFSSVYGKGFIDYETGACKFTSFEDYLLPVGTVLLASYFFTLQSVNITEVGFRNKNNILVHYATFPPFEFASNAYHLSYLFLVKKVLKEKK